MNVYDCGKNSTQQILYQLTLNQQVLGPTNVFCGKRLNPKRIQHPHARPGDEQIKLDNVTIYTDLKINIFLN